MSAAFSFSPDCTILALAAGRRYPRPPWGHDPETEQVSPYPWSLTGKRDYCLMSVVHFFLLSSRCVTLNCFGFYLPKYCTWLFAVSPEPNVFFFVCF